MGEAPSIWKDMMRVLLPGVRSFSPLRSSGVRTGRTLLEILRKPISPKLSTLRPAVFWNDSSSSRPMSPSSTLAASSRLPNRNGMSNTAHFESSCTASEPMGMTSSWPVRTCCMCTISSPKVPLSKYSMATWSPSSALSASRNEASICWVDAPGVLSTESRNFRTSALAPLDTSAVASTADRTVVRPKNFLIAISPPE